ncbi:MAG TPA: TOMM precursor leader peptide-binding protein, partial [Bryobacteraceae bacterium]|nr:TOMM precursor leader peptide-binding protein [Bryobacteraceae bacterium]
MMLASESDCLLFQQSLHCAILRFCETPRTQSQIQTHCSIHPPAAVSAALKELIAKRVLTTKVFPESRRDAAFWASTGVSPQPCEVDLQTHGSVPDALLRNALSSYSIAIDAAAFIALVAVDDYLQPDLARYLNHPKPFLLAKPVGASIWIGPIFTPQSRPCWNCLRLWMLPHRWLQFSRFCSSQPNLAPQPSLAATNATLATAAGLISTAVAIWSSSRRHPRLENRTVTLDVRTLESQQHVLRPHPDCPTCGSLARPIGELRQLVSPITGIVNKLDLTDRPAGALFHAAAQVVHALPSHAVTSVLPPQRTIG